MRLIETLQVGPAHANHSRSIYVGHGFEMWHEIRIPSNIIQMALHGIHERAELFVAQLPHTPPAEAVFCGEQEPLYGSQPIKVIVWEGEGCEERAAAYAAAHANDTVQLRIAA